MTLGDAPVTGFVSSLERVRRAEPRAAPPTLADLSTLSEAADLYRGEFLASFYISSCTWTSAHPLPESSERL